MNYLWHYVQSVIGLIMRHPVVGVCIIPLLEDGRIILVRRRDNGRWSLPGGMVEWGDDIKTSLHRELQEETGLDVTSVDRLVGVYSAPDRDLRLHSICVTVAVNVQGEIKINDPLEISDVQAFVPGEIPLDQLSHDHQRHLQDFWQGLTTVA